MHPIEWLRAIARSEDVPHGELAAEAAAALAGLADEPLGMLPACRRLLDRHPEVGPLWWACARLLSAADPVVEARTIRADLAADQVGLSLALDLPSDVKLGVATVGWSALTDEVAERRPDLDLVTDLDRALDRGPDDTGAAVTRVLLLVDVWSAGDQGFLARPGTRELAQGVRGTGGEVWAAVAVGRRLPEPLFKAQRRRLADAGTDADLLTAADLTRVVEPLVIGCPCPLELL